MIWWSSINPAALSRLLVPSARLGLIRLDSIAKLERGLGPARIDRFNRQFAVSLYGNVAPGHALGEAASATQAIVDRVGLPPGYNMVFSGQVKILEETTTNMILAIALASIFMYMVLAAQFESLVHPFIILLTLPLSIPFALISLTATGRGSPAASGRAGGLVAELTHRCVSAWPSAKVNSAVPLW